MLNAYLLLSGTSHLHPTWPEARRITTAAHVVAICCIESEMGRAEAESCLVLAAGMLRMLSKGCEPAMTGLKTIERLADLLGESLIRVLAVYRKWTGC